MRYGDHYARTRRTRKKRKINYPWTAYTQNIMTDFNGLNSSLIYIWVFTLRAIHVESKIKVSKVVYESEVYEQYRMTCQQAFYTHGRYIRKVAILSGSGIIILKATWYLYGSPTSSPLPQPYVTLPFKAIRM